MLKNSLIIYFSRAGENYAVGDVKKGNTEYLAEFIREFTKADIFKVEREPEYSNDYNICVKESLNEWKNKILPALKKEITSIDQYQNIFIGGPIYFGVFPQPVTTQLSKLNFKNKDVFPFITHEGSGEANVLTYLNQFCQDAKIHDPLVIYGHEAKNSRDEVKKWINKNKITI